MEQSPTADKCSHNERFIKLKRCEKKEDNQKVKTIHQHTDPRNLFSMEVVHSVIDRSACNGAFVMLQNAQIFDAIRVLP